MPVPKQKDRIYVPITSINAADRIRADYGDLDSLKESLTKNGLIQPVVVNQHNVLIAGGRRLRAHAELGETEIAVVYYETLNSVQLRVLEVEENVVRKDFDWRERVMAVVVAHEAARKHAIVDEGHRQWTIRQSGELLGMSAGNVHNYIKLADCIRAGDQEIIKADGVKAAFNILLLRKQREGEKLIAALTTGRTGSTISAPDALKVLESAKATKEEDFFEQTDFIVGGSGGAVRAPDDGEEMPGQAATVSETPIQEAPVFNLSDSVLKGNSLKLMQERFSEGEFDHIVTDIPYGVDTEMQSQENAGANTKSMVGSVAEAHDVESNVADFPYFIEGSYRVLKQNGYLVFWCDIMHWQRLYDLSVAVGFKVQRWPLVWVKTHTCKNQAAQYNFTKTVEIAMVCRKGNATLMYPQNSCVWTGGNEEVLSLLQHPYVKPFNLWKWILNGIAYKGQKIYDPYAGVGSMPLAAISVGYQPICSELEDVHYNRLVVNVANAYRTLAPTAKFV